MDNLIAIKPPNCTKKFTPTQASQNFKMYKMKKHSNLNRVTSLTVLLTITISTLATPAASSNDVVMNIPKTDHEHITIIPGGTALCSVQDKSREQTLSLGDSAYILTNHTVTLVFESPCFREKHFIMFHSKIWYNILSWKNILVVKFTTGGLVLNTENGLVIKNENEIAYSENDFLKINSEIRKGGDCLKRLNNMTINIFEEDNYGLFMGKCDLDFEKHIVDLCGIFNGNYKISPEMVQYQMNPENILITKNKNNLKFEIVIKPMSTTVTIKTKYCDEQVHITKFSPRDFVNNLHVMGRWFRFDYNVIKSLFSSSISISISGIPIDYWNYEEPVCDEEPEFTFIGVNDIKRECQFSQIYSYASETRNPVYTSETQMINFPYIITILLIILGKAICGYGIYKRRQARLIAFTARRIGEHYENVSPGRSNIIIVSANQQSESQFHSQRQPTDDLPPAYSDLQQTDSHPPGYEDACKSKSLSPPGYEYACRDNTGFQMETEISSSNNMKESMNINQVSTEDSSTVSSNLC